MLGELPRSLTVNGVEYAIRTDFRVVLDIVSAFEDPELKQKEKQYVCLYLLYEDFDKIPIEDYQAAYEAAVSFLDAGTASSNKPTRTKTMSWEQDEPLIFPAVNKVAGCEVRSLDYLHWWTFLGYFMEIKDSTYATILQLRQKKARGQKMEKWEKDYWSQHKDLCVLRTKLTQEEIAEKERLKAILG